MGQALVVGEEYTKPYVSVLPSFSAILVKILN